MKVKLFIDDLMSEAERPTLDEMFKKSYVTNNIKHEFFFEDNPVISTDNLLPNMGKTKWLKAQKIDDDGTMLDESIGYGDIYCFDDGEHIMILNYSTTQVYSGGSFLVDDTMRGYVYMSLAKEIVIDELELMITAAILNYKGQIIIMNEMEDATAPTPNREEIFPSFLPSSASTPTSSSEIVGNCCIIYHQNIPVMLESIPTGDAEDKTEIFLNDLIADLDSRGFTSGQIDGFITAHQDDEP